MDHHHHHRHGKHHHHGHHGGGGWKKHHFKHMKHHQRRFPHPADDISWIFDPDVLDELLLIHQLYHHHQDGHDEQLRGGGGEEQQLPSQPMPDFGWRQGNRGRYDRGHAHHHGHHPYGGFFERGPRDFGGWRQWGMMHNGEREEPCEHQVKTEPL